MKSELKVLNSEGPLALRSNRHLGGYHDANTHMVGPGMC